MAGILDFLSGGQYRRRALDEAASKLMYYIPPHLRDAFGLVAEMNPVQGIGTAMGGARTAADPSYSPEQRRQGLLDAAIGTGIAAVPTALAARGYAAPAAAVIESFLGGSPASMQLQEGAGRLAADAIGAGRSIASGDFGLLDEVLQPGREARSLSAGAAAETPTGIRAYHGSPHDFDRFSMDAIGTGEGAQAYGHGLYFAEAEPVARGYRDMLSDRPTEVTIHGERYHPDALDGLEADAARAALEYDSPAGWRQYLSRYYDEDQVNEAMALLEDGTIKAAPAGRMYEVNIDANPEAFLDWDKPLSEQPKAVQDFANARWQQVYGRGPDPSIEGEYIAKMASPQHGIDGLDWLETGPAADASRRMREAGIPGIKYLDAMSRNAGEGSRNYVVFDENLINIVRKYGIAGAAAVLGVSVADVEAAMAQAQPAPRTPGLLVQ